MRQVALLLAGLLLTACTTIAASPSPEPGLAGTRSDGEPFHVVINDEAGWMVGVTADWKLAAPPDFGWDRARVENDPDDPRTVTLSWFGGACDHHQRVTLRAQRGRLLMLFSPGGMELQGGDTACPMVGLGYAIRFTFDRNIPADTVGLSISTSTRATP